MYDPEGDTGAIPINDDEIEAALRAQGQPTADPNTVDLAESMMQPDSEESNRERPREDLQAAMEGSDVDPYAQYTGEEVDIPTGVDRGEVDPDGNLIDEPDYGDGVEAGMLNMETENKNQKELDTSNLEDLENLQNSGGKGGD
jgi:hypothetical protein